MVQNDSSFKRKDFPYSLNLLQDPALWVVSHENPQNKPKHGKRNKHSFKKGSPTLSLVNPGFREVY